MQTNPTQPPGPTETHNVVGEDNDKIHLPKVKNSSQATKLARFLFGPLTRVRTTMLDDKEQVTVSVERNGHKDVLGSGSTVDEALTSALTVMIAANKNGASIPDTVMPARNAVNTVDEKRHRLVIKVAGYKPEDFNHLHPHEVLEITELLQMKGNDTIKLIMDKAVIRGEVKKKEMEVARVKLEKALAEVDADHPDNLFDVSAEEHTVVLDGVALTEQMIVDALSNPK